MVIRTVQASASAPQGGQGAPGSRGRGDDRIRRRGRAGSTIGMATIKNLSPRSVGCDLLHERPVVTFPDATPNRGRSLRSTVSSSGELRLELAERDVPEPGGSEVVVAVEASPINPSDLGVLLGAVAPGTLRPDGPDLVGIVPGAALPLYRDRLDKPLPVGNEGAGTVIAAGSEAAALIGRRVALFGGSMWADYRVADAAAVVELPDDVSTEEGAALPPARQEVAGRDFRIHDSTGCLNQAETKPEIAGLG
jgi:hypothetical protein